MKKMIKPKGVLLVFVRLFQIFGLYVYPSETINAEDHSISHFKPTTNEFCDLPQLYINKLLLLLSLSCLVIESIATYFAFDTYLKPSNEGSIQITKYFLWVTSWLGLQVLSNTSIMMQGKTLRRVFMRLANCNSIHKKSRKMSTQTLILIALTAASSIYCFSLEFNYIILRGIGPIPMFTILAWIIFYTCLNLISWFTTYAISCMKDQFIENFSVIKNIQEKIMSENEDQLKKKKIRSSKKLGKYLSGLIKLESSTAVTPSPGTTRDRIESVIKTNPQQHIQQKVSSFQRLIANDALNFTMASKVINENHKSVFLEHVPGADAIQEYLPASDYNSKNCSSSTDNCKIDVDDDDVNLMDEEIRYCEWIALDTDITIHQLMNSLGVALMCQNLMTATGMVFSCYSVITSLTNKTEIVLFDIILMLTLGLIMGLPHLSAENYNNLVRVKMNINMR